MNAARSHVDLIKFIFDRRLHGDLEPLLNAVSDDVEWRSMGEPGAVPWSGTWHGKEGVLAFFDAVAGAVDVIGFDPIDFMADDGQIAVLGKIRFQARGSSVIREELTVDVFTIRDGKIVKFWEIFQVQPVIASLHAGA